MSNKNKSIWKQYCKRLIECYKNIDVLSIPDLSESRKMPLKKLYVPLKFAPPKGEEKEVIEEKDLFNYNYLVILGDPGSGKSTWMLHTVIEMAEAFLKKGESVVPIPIILRDYMQHYKEMDFAQHFFKRLETDLQLETIPSETDLKELFSQGKAVVLLDGIDEVGGRELRASINNKIESFLKTFPGTRLWCTSRIVGYYETPLPTFKKYTDFIGPDIQHFMTRKSPLFFHIKIKAFNEEQISQFIHHWYGIREWNPRERSERTDSLEVAIDANERIAQLAVNPLMLSMIAMVHRKLARLPEERAELYRVLTESLLEHWELQKYRNIIPGGNPLTTKLRRMEHLAEHMMTLSPEYKSDERVILIPENEVKHIFKQAILEKEHIYRGKEDAAGLEADNFLQYVKTRTGLLMERGRGNYAFVHLSFQEYLTASYLNRYYLNRWTDFLDDYGKRLFDSLWKETMAIFFEIVATNDPASLNELFAVMLDMDELPLHLMVIMIYNRPELEEKKKEKTVYRLCQKVLRKDFEFWLINQEQADWRELIRDSYEYSPLSTIGGYCWKSFLENLPSKKGKALQRWAGHFITSYKWVKDVEKLSIFFKKACSYKSDPYILACLAAVLPDFSADKQELIEKYILKSLPAKLTEAKPEEVLPLVVFSHHRPDSSFGPVGACVSFFILINKAQALEQLWYLDLCLDCALDLYLDRVLNSNWIRDFARTVFRDMGPFTYRLGTLTDQERPDFRARDRAIIDFYSLKENKLQWDEGRKHKRIASFWINIGIIYILFINKERLVSNKKLTDSLLKHPEVQPNMTDPWERFGFTLYQMAKNPKDKKIQEDLKAITEKPEDEDLDRLLRLLHLKK